MKNGTWVTDVTHQTSTYFPLNFKHLSYRGTTTYTPAYIVSNVCSQEATACFTSTSFANCLLVSSGASFGVQRDGNHWASYRQLDGLQSYRNMSLFHRYQKEILHKVQLRESLYTPESRSVSDNDDNGSTSCEWEPLNKMAPGESNSIIAAKWLDSGVSNEAWRRTNLLPPQQFLNELLTIWLIDTDCTSFLLSARTGMSEHFLRHSLTRSDLYWILVL